MSTTLREYLSEGLNKITPEYLLIDKAYIDSGGNIIGSDTYKANDYEKYDYISVDAHSFLINWCWNETNLRFYQKHGLDGISDEVIKELSKWRPNGRIELYRAVCDKKGETKYKNRLKSYFKTLEAAEILLEDMGCFGYIQTINTETKDILVDMTMIPNYSELDLLDEVIVIV